MTTPPSLAGKDRACHPDARAGATLSDRRGFALLITITLLAFLVLLLVSLATLTRVETQVAGNSQKQAQARQNALMALNIALGQLQKYAGPDQRITATADLATGNGTGRRFIVGTDLSVSGTVGGRKYWDTTNTLNGLNKVQPGTRYWTGVWGNYDPSTPTAGNGNIYEKTPRPVLLNWLVSGNEGATFQASTASADFGRVTTLASGVAKTPVTAASPAITTTTSATDALKIGASDAVLLVGANTAGTQSRTVESTLTETATDRYIVAPLVPINAPTGSVPGLGAAAAPPIGRYAYWVGDEGVKARINLADPYAANTTPATDPLAKARLLTAPRSGAEVVKDTGSSGVLSDFSDTAYATWSQAGASIPKAIAFFQLGMIDSSTLTPVVLGRHFNDFTTYSVGVESDAYNGGLKRDLTYYLEQATFPTWTGTDGQTVGKDYGIIPAAYSPVMDTLTTSDKRVPRWDIVQSFYNMPSGTDGNGHTNQLTGQSSDVVYVRPATATQMGIFPMVTQMRILVGVTGNSSTTTATTDTAAVPSIPAKTIRQLANVIIELANPYSVTLSAPGGVDVQFNNDTRITDGNKFRIHELSANKDVGWLSDVLGGGAGRITLHIPAFTLSKGQAAVFYVSGAQKVINGQASTVPLTQMGGTPPNAGGATFTDYIYCDYGNWTPTLDSNGQVKVRGWETGDNATMIAEFSMPGTSQLLKQIGGINFNRNSSLYHQIAFTPTLDPGVNNPVFVYACQYNEAGDDFPYGSGNQGEGNTALRAWMDFNPRAGYYRVTNASYVAAPYVQYFMPASQELMDFNTGLATLYWGRSVGSTSSMANATVSTAILFDLPRKTTGATNDFSVMSLAALQHANLAAEDIPSASATDKAYSGYKNFDWEFGTNTVATAMPPSPGHQPAYAVGNSYASIFLPRGKTVFTPDAATFPYQMDAWGSYVTNDNGTNGMGQGVNAQVARNYYDISYLLNTALWDGYFLSTIPQSGSAYLPINPRLMLRGDVSANTTLVRDGIKAAGYTLVKGAFNINSTSEDAWAAVLGGMKNLPNIPGVSSSGSNASAVFPRTPWQAAAAVSPPTGTQNDSYSGYRQLTDADIRSLATAIVKQVRMRGPFVSLAQFVNRVLVDATNTTEQSTVLGQAGALQRAIDTANLNVFSDPAASAANDKAVIPTANDGSVMMEAGSRGAFSLYADGANAGSPTAPLQRSTAIPGWLTQADVLQAIGPVLSARSDTFIIRTYGDVISPVTGSATPDARAWCEAVVQRIPDYVDPADPALTTYGNGTAPSAVNTVNQTFGRSFKVVSFRWLSPNDI